MFWNIFVLGFCAMTQVLAAAAPGPDNNSRSGNCILPPQPAYGNYVVEGVSNASPGQGFQFAKLDYTCHPGYGIDNGESQTICVNGVWSLDGFPECVRFCKLQKHPSIEYHCLISGNSSTRVCDEQEPSGTVVTPECNAPNYYFPGELVTMECTEGIWNYVAICSPECGILSSSGAQLTLDSTDEERRELPWHAGIYMKTTSPYMQICGGSLVSTSVVISAAHCFWDHAENKALPASQYAVALGKLYRPWNNEVDSRYDHKSDVSTIHIPSRFKGFATNFENDIAVLLLATEVDFKIYVRPVCLDFSFNQGSGQLESGKVGKFAGWGYTAASGQASLPLKVVDIPYVSTKDCLAAAPNSFRPFITSDKICAGFTNGTATALYKGDGGGGLSFPEYDRSTQRFYLRGVASVVSNTAGTPAAFTHISKHEEYLNEYII